MINNQTAIKELEALIAKYEELRNKSKYDDLSDQKEEMPVLALRLQSALDRHVVPNGTYAKAAEVLRTSAPHVQVVKLAHIAMALVEDLKNDIGSISA